MSASRSLNRLQRTSTFVTSLRCPRNEIARTARHFAAPSPSTRLTRTTLHSFSTTYRRRDVQEPEKYVKELADDGLLALEEEMLLAQNAAIAEFEQGLGKSLERAVIEDELADKVLRGQYALEYVEEDEDIAEEDEPDNDVLSALREAGLSDEEVVREARNAFGDYLPEDALSEDEFALYKRLYGDPPVKSRSEERNELDVIDDLPQDMLFDPAGQQVAYRLESQQDIADSMQSQAAAALDNWEDENGVRQEIPLTDLAQAARAQEVARSLGGELVDDEGLEEDIFEPVDVNEGPHDTRAHPLTSLGRFRTYPSTTFLPKDQFVQPIQRIMRDSSNKHLKEMCEKTFGGKGLPDSPLTPRSGRSRQQLPIPLGASQHSMGHMEANAFITAVMPPTYASILAILAETRRRLGPTWLSNLMAKEGGPRILDAGSGGVGALAWQDTIKAHWETLHSSDKNPPPLPESKLVVLTGSDTLRHRAAAMLDNTTFVPRLPDYASTRQIPTLDDDRPAQQKKHFDVIIASHSLFPLKEEWERKQYVQNLWSQLGDDGGVLILMEKGIPRGFEAIAAARDMLLDRYIAVPDGQSTYYSTCTASGTVQDEAWKKTPGMIIAPCTNHERCPLYKVGGVSKGRRDICSFQQRYIRPPFLQTILQARDRNHDDVDFSYIAVMKGEDLRTRAFTTWEHVNDPMSAPAATSVAGAANAAAQGLSASLAQKGFEHIDPTWSESAAPPPAHTLPRVIYEPLKRQGHVTLDVCTPQAEIRRWTIPKSFSRQAYRDARKARWGDLWALGAKTDIPRNLRLGTPSKEMATGEGMKRSANQPRSRKERLEMQAETILQAQEAQKDEEQSENEMFMQMLDEKSMADEEDNDLIDMDTLMPKRSKKHTHAKIDGVNVLGKATPPKANSTAEPRQPQTASPRASHPSPSQQETEINKLDYTPGRYGEDDNLAEWRDEFSSMALEDEARRGVQKSGRRPTQKNTYRFKKQLRRARRERGQL